MVTTANTSQAAAGAEGRRPSASARGAYEWTLLLVAGLFGIISVWFVGTIIWQSASTFKTQGLYIFTGANWIPGAGTGVPSQYGGRAMIIGTFETSLIAMIIAVVIGTGTSLAINFFLPQKLKTFVATVVELLAAIPSVVYGVWGMLVLAPWFLNTVGPFLSSLPGGTAILGTTVAGKSLLLAGIVLAVMVLPTYVAISREVISSVPHELVEASLSLGATRWQTLWKTVIPTARIGLFGATSLALGRAIGETVAVSLVCGGVVGTSFKPLEPGVSIAGWIATQWGEAVGSDQIGALFALGAILMVVSLAMSIFSRRLVAKQRRAAAVV
jgi:phosphate transport system permease protein